MAGQLEKVVGELANLDYQKVESNLKKCIADFFKRTGREKAIVGVSGGVDSAVALALCARALKPENVLGLVMPTKHTPNQDLADAKALLKKLNCEYELFSLDKIVDEMASCWSMRPDKMVLGNLTARVRMAHLYAHANSLNGLVVGTGDRSEISIGYFTKFGDGGCDLLPIGGLLKTQVRKLGEHLGLPTAITAKPSSPALWGDQSAEKELETTYEKVDAYLWMSEKGLSMDQIVKVAGKKDAARIRQLIEYGSHKLEPVPILPI
ncbi:NAD(+) synthetase [Candidatus Micrarchaeota archaeon CG08_land_8_20_14_0_20_49_17]|nr:MAG: NAD(+) synthase [Candidatus Micrarchaeota archaeon CG1_02_49_24]PIU09778.1 MAG: NAD(+) synthetase [Candidatus Micrarchaeota archaeon CG08_land_8_20_14_0_20_49_17]PIZ93645.1 MAG: NAD(+) synthetase [Candidatus Micrarchaeota archaeon CG_4_10_14_0_2_um_filter_49_7]